MNREEFLKNVNSNIMDISEEQLQLFCKYLNYLKEYNSHTNLTAIRDDESIFLKHFYDSLIILKHYNFENMEVLDIGSGAGFPGVPLKIMVPSIKLTVLDSNNKKTKFLTNLKNILNIEYSVVNDRAENFVTTTRENYDVVISRAVTQMPILAELSMPFLKIGGSFIALKGNIDETLENGKYAISVLGGEIIRIVDDLLPIENAKRTFVIVDKISETDKMFPRPFDKINKKPLQK